MFKKLYKFHDENKRDPNEEFQGKIENITERFNRKSVKHECNNEKTNNMFYKIEMKDLKEDSAVLENFEEEKKLEQPKIKHKTRIKIKINFSNHLVYIVKNLLGIKLNENNLRYKFLDLGYHMLMNGFFIYKKLQEFELFKKMNLTKQELKLLYILKKPRLCFESHKLESNIYDFKEFGLYPIDFLDNEFQTYKKKNRYEVYEELKTEKISNKNKNERILDIFRYLIAESKE